MLKYFNLCMIYLFIDHEIWKILFRFIIVIILANSFQNISLYIQRFLFFFLLILRGRYPLYSVQIDFQLDINICTKNVLPFCWLGRWYFILRVLRLHIQKLEYPQLDFIFNFRNEISHFHCRMKCYYLKLQDSKILLQS